eukprot:TRINITY_DN3552_c0_g1_i1.p2 TRINITY_DN3552_c0_g1~~TRINITY_DN3552_c0_g1_i1.p2  ORF type:complete len:327 (-),score=85.98 TRINITY_DN3552_c0_g1_i1:123-1103(-)
MLNILDAFLVQFIPDTEAQQWSPAETLYDYRTIPKIRSSQKNAMKMSLQRSSHETQSKAMQSVFLFAVTWSLGAVLDVPSRAKFDEFLKEQSAMLDPTCTFPEEGTIYDYYFQFPSLKWTKWTNPKEWEDYKSHSEAFVGSVVIPNNENQARLYVLDLLIQAGKPALLCGPTGVGKTLEASQLIFNGLSKDYAPLSVTFSRSTLSSHVQQTIETNLERFKAQSWGPIGALNMGLLLDNINAPKPETYGAQPPLEFVRQYFDHNGWYDLKDLTFKHVFGLNTIATMGVNLDISPRFLRHFNIIYCPEPKVRYFAKAQLKDSLTAQRF